MVLKNLGLMVEELWINGYIVSQCRKNPSFLCIRTASVVNDEEERGGKSEQNDCSGRICKIQHQQANGQLHRISEECDPPVLQGKKLNFT